MNKIKDIIKKILPKRFIVFIQNSNRKKKYGGDYISREKKYKGDYAFCYCCGNGVKKFLRYYPVKIAANRSKKIEKNVWCPICFSLARQRAECYLLLNNTKQYTYEKGDNIILFAPEKSIKFFLERQKIDFKTSDLFRDDCDFKLDLCDIDLPDNSQKLIFCNHILEHVPDDKKAMSELSRILHADGIAFITVPIDFDLEMTKEMPPEYWETMTCEEIKKERERLFGQFDHLRLYGGNFIEILRNYFDVETFDGSEIDPISMPAFGPSAHDANVIFICKKKNL